MRISAREFSGIKGPTGHGLLADARSYAAKRSGPGAPARFLLEGLLFSALANLPTVLGSLLRPLAYRLVLGGIGPGGYIERNVRFNIPRRVYLIATHVAIMSYQHGFSDRAVPVADQDIELKPVVIEEDVWIGTHALVLPGVRIGRGSIIGAGAVVTSDLPPYSVAVGSPARVIRQR